MYDNNDTKLLDYTLLQLFITHLILAIYDTPNKITNLFSFVSYPSSWFNIIILFHCIQHSL